MIQLYNCADDVRVIDKTLTATLLFDTCKFKDSTNIITPYVIISANTGIFNYSSNYAYISDFDRYYFIKNIDVLTGSRVGLSLEIDVLFTYRNQIKNISALCVRNELINWNDLADENIPFFSDKNIRVIELENSALNINIANENTLNYILNIAGGGIGNGSE